MSTKGFVVLRAGVFICTLEVILSFNLYPPGALEKAILEDESCSVESWSEIAARCEQTGRLPLAQDITSTLLLLDGTVRLSPGLDSAQLMEHVFM